MTARKRRSDSKIYEYRGESKTAREWADELGVTVKTFKRRLREGRSPDEVFSQDLRIGDDYGKYMQKYMRKLEREVENRRYGKNT